MPIFETFTISSYERDVSFYIVIPLYSLLLVCIKDTVNLIEFAEKNSKTYRIKPARISIIRIDNNNRRITFGMKTIPGWEKYVKSPIQRETKIKYRICIKLTSIKIINQEYSELNRFREFFTKSLP